MSFFRKKKEKSEKPICCCNRPMLQQHFRRIKLQANVVENR